jgi:ribonuclease VapC
VIVDTSALIAVMESEPQAAEIADLLAELGAQVSAATLVEARIVAYRKGGAEARHRLDRLVRQLDLAVSTVDSAQADAASDAYAIYGKGTGHPAQLNYGDTFSYALAALSDEPLLFVGDDFSRTDIRSALEEYGA